ncbi:MAG TPA: iron hydrogenase small subunit, partial [bacterium]|nr:iron hydrogenase small subunit [bacterium]
ATLRTAAEIMTENPNCRLEFQEVRAVEGIRETYVDLGARTISIGVANGLENAKMLLDKTISGEKEIHVIEVMACPGGCIGGGGQPYPPQGFKILDPRLIELRAKAIYSIDAEKKYRRSHQNPAIKTLYSEFLGEPGSEKAHKLLHTKYEPKFPRGIK